MKFKFMFLLIPLLVNCSAPIMQVANEFQKNNDIKISIEKFKDYTEKYSENYEIENKIVDKINKEYKGILINYNYKTTPPSYKKNPNPFVAFNKADIDTQITEDIIIKGDIETIYYGSVNESVAAGFFALGIIGAAMAESHNKNNAYAFISIKTQIINAHNNIIMFDGIFSGKSKSGKVTELTQRKAIGLAIDDYTDQILKFLSRKK